MPAADLDARGRRLRASLAAVLVRDDAPELRLIHDWLDTWSGLGLVVAGMTHQGWDVQLTAYGARDWRATFFPVGIAHSIVGGSAYEPTPWRAGQKRRSSTVVLAMFDLQGRRGRPQHRRPPTIAVARRPFLSTRS